ncbi:metallophosphoesterase family protein [Novosphingobium taihuense]|uniref:Serine/threonine protein phosphatase 1 n=1 Tax=Novosphingobium taihuense TaxID=260085 RepID=A0A7W7A805_9SPHN|nr:metallophosphoesterase family protein [Novosphingobium taihuense]MBB4611902.1 serine/threonine protein phosphatase 1 [Novosphingobium taihuense]TWH88743.1 serine/threonine protein phosphatase 1 [Novosphingobium taihuense]
MFNKLRSLFSPVAEEPVHPQAALPPGQRAYAIGDIHGRLDLFEQLLARIDEDDAARGSAQTTLILLGDLVDRGPDSRGVVERAMDLMATRKVRVLAGNHEEMLLGSLENEETLRHFLRHGGKETLFSYGLTLEEYSRAKLDEICGRANALIPADHVAFMRAMENQIVMGDYLFVHAGIRPGVPLDQQMVADMRWIRREFLEHGEPHSHLVVHGHTITDEPVVCPNRIGIDTGAFASGRLTALGMEGDDRWFLTAIIEPEEREAA